MKNLQSADVGDISQPNLTTSSSEERVALRTKLNKVFLDANLLQRKSHGGIDYLALSDDLKTDGIDIKIWDNMFKAGLKIGVVTTSYDQYEDVKTKLCTVINDAELTDVGIFHTGHYNAEM